MIKQMVVGFRRNLMLLWTLRCGFLEHLHSLREVKCLLDCSKTLKMSI